MTKSAAPRVALPAELAPSTDTKALVSSYLDRLLESGGTQAAVAAALGVNNNFISMLRSTQGLPLPLVIPLARALGLDEAETNRLLDARLLELHGQKGEICVEALARWADATFAARGDDAQVIELWRTAIQPAPHLLQNILADGAVSRRLADFMASLVQESLCAMKDEALV